jgi:hypothetical protein
MLIGDEVSVNLLLQAGWQQGAFTQMQTQEVVERIPVQKMVTEYQEVRRQVQVPVQMVPQQVQVMSELYGVWFRVCGLACWVQGLGSRGYVWRLQIPVLVCGFLLPSLESGTFK